MTYICTICISDLNSNVPVAVSCGHLFHRTCIETWMSSHSAGGSRRNASSCPLCKKSISKKDISGPLFFSTNESVEPEPPTSVQDKLKIEELEESKKQLLNHLNEMAHSLVLTNEKLSQAQTEIRQQETVKEKYQSTVRYLKQLKRVADIDDYLSQPTTQAYLGTLSRLPRPELVVAIGGLKARCVQLANERDIAVKKVDRFKRKEEELTEKVKALSKKLTRLKAKNKNINKPYDTSDLLRHDEPSTSRDIIVLDSDDNNGGTDDDNENKPIIESSSRQPMFSTPIDEELYSSSDDSDGDNLLYTVADNARRIHGTARIMDNSDDDEDDDNQEVDSPRLGQKRPTYHNNDMNKRMRTEGVL
ncbi:hypothetical protein G6F70_006665 [Rhizopus microsporus]|nr:hypothetical protein G6F71_006633 [Rhizopus microsporus]KAG1197382.1 hypothetical protein G6F70_006665 [Rhizopus microsporus]KAG1213487.1 hypothetical protein G6F69_002769 [Rhizopus microsporus]KAG1230573.1 hypothetical protein G6F67_006365 [Rhizopus microsporus]KAG1268103.1 hypothetical protein G6F68_001387 [Rhizopus microsporus]